MGTKFYEDYINFVQDQLDILGQDENLDEVSIQRAVDEAVKRYSQDRPRRHAQQYTGTGEYRYDLPDSWVEGFSIIERIESPDRERTPTYIRVDEWDVYDNGDGNGRQLQFFSFAPSSSNTFTVHYIGKHTIGASESSVFDYDFEAVGYLASSILCLRLAGQLLKSRDANKAADAINFRTLSDEYEKLSKILFEKYTDHMSLPMGMGDESISGGIAPTLSIGDIQVIPPWGSRGYLTHGRR